jgi:hypothetical protein
MCTDAGDVRDDGHWIRALCIKMIDTVGVAQMSDFVLYIASPAVVLLSFETDFSVDKLVGAAWCAGIYAAITGISIAL